MSNVIPTMQIHQSQLNSDCSISIAGYRHASNVLLSACVVVPGKTILKNLAHLVDTDIMLALMKKLGAMISFQNNIATIDTKNLNYSDPIDTTLCEKIHGSLYLMPALLARFGYVEFEKSGGCQIGSTEEKGERPIHHILDVMKAFGANIVISNGKIKAVANTLEPTVIDIRSFSYEKNRISGPLTSGATKTAILLALGVKKGKTIILHPLLKSEVIDLLNFVKKLGFYVNYDKEKLEICSNVIANTTTHQVISDPSEIITYMCLAVYHKISIKLDNITMPKTADILAPELELLKKIGVQFYLTDSCIIVNPSKNISACNIDITPEHICTDHHPFLLAILLQANGISTITEYVWHERFQYIPELNKLGIHLSKARNSVTIAPQSPQKANEILHGIDLRAAALLLIIALKTPGITLMQHFSHLYRGYENLFEKLSTLGAKIIITNVNEFARNHDEQII